MEKNKNAEKKHTIMQDINRMSFETLRKLNNTAVDAGNEIRGTLTLEEAVLQSELYGKLFEISMIGNNRLIDTYMKEEKYWKMELHELLKELYGRMKMFHHYAVAKGAELPGIAWSIENNGVFAINLRECALNMEYSFEDPDAELNDKSRDGILFCIGLNVPLLETEDPEADESHLWGEYDEFLNFCCVFRDDKEYRDIYPCEPSHKQAIRFILAQLDLIADMNKINPSNE